MSANLWSTGPFDVCQPMKWPFPTRSRPPPSRSFSPRPVHLWREVSLRFHPSQLISFHLSLKLNTQRARRASGPRLMGLLKLRGIVREKKSGFLPPPVHPRLSLLPLFVQLSFNQSSTPPSNPIPPPLS